MAVRHITRPKYHLLEVWPHERYRTQDAFEQWCRENITVESILLLGASENPVTGKPQGRFVFHVEDINDVALVKIVHG